MKIVSIQSAVAFGHVGNSAAVFPLQCTGDAAGALARTASSVFNLLTKTLESGESELQLVESQQYYAEPRMQFTVRQVS